MTRYFLWHLLSCVIWFQGKSETVAFWHIYGQNNINYSTIIQDQWQVLSSSGLLQKIDRIYYLTVGTATPIVNWHEKLQHLGHIDIGHEVITLNHMQLYCKAHSNSKVLYFHNKGSFNPTKRNFLFRQALDCYNLNSHCIESLDRFDTCGMRISPVPSMHYSGNYFWATCNHIAKLIDPLSMNTNFTLREGTMNISAGRPTWCLGMARHFAEVWIASRPLFAPADCMGVSRHRHYLYGEDIRLSVYQEYCPNARSNEIMPDTALPPKVPLPYGESCNASKVTFAPISLAFRIFSETKSDESSCSSIHANVRRSFLWYGQPPILYLMLMKKNLGVSKWKEYSMYDKYLL